MSNVCPRCLEEAKLRSRTFSDQANAAFLSWGELSADSVSKPLCDHCYGELRDILIDRSSELETAPAPAAAGGKSSQKVG